LCSYFGAPSLTRGRVCNLVVQFTVPLRPKSKKTCGHILLFHWRLLDSISIASCDSQGYGGGILARLQTRASLPQSQSQSYLTTDVSRPVCPCVRPSSRPVTKFFLPSNFLYTFAGLLFCGALSDKRTGLQFTVAAVPRQRGPSQV
jgi:hypothetical protein